MSDDKTRLGQTPPEPSGAHPRPQAPDPKAKAAGSGSLRPPNEATIVSSAEEPRRTKTLSGVPAMSPTPASGAIIPKGPSDSTVVLGNAGAAPVPPHTMPNGTPAST